MGRYVDVSAIVQIIGNIYNNVSLLDYEDYHFNEDDFPEQFHKILFGSIYNLHALGAKEVTLNAIEDYLTQRPSSYAVYKTNKGHEYLEQISKQVDAATFDYYYKRMKKFTLLRMYHEKCGMDLSNIYDIDNILNVKKKQLQEDFLDNSSFEDIIQKIDNKIQETIAQYVPDEVGECYQAGEGIEALIDRLKEYPEVGIPLYGPLVNTVSRGARLKKFYLRSAPSGCGKTRTLIADACYVACNRIYDETFGWIKNGIQEPVLYITTEQELEEIQTMMLAFLSYVDEEHILNGTYEGDEEDRVREAGRIIAESPIYVEVVPDFSLKDIEDKIKKHIREHDVKYVFHDYIHTSLKILEEITRRSGGIKLREDNVLFMLSIKLKDLCNQHGIFIESATQLNGDWKDAEIPDQNLLRGAKAIADKIDLGEILLPVNDKDLESLETILASNAFERPNLKISVYKNRRGRYKSIYLWCKAELGTCRVKPMFCTTYGYEAVKIEDLKIFTEEQCAFE